MYLKGAVIDEATKVIESIPAAAVSYNIAWTALIERFDNKQTLVNRHLRILCADLPLRRGGVNELKRLLTNCRQNLRALEALGLPIDNWDPIIIHLIN